VDNVDDALRFARSTDTPAGWLSPVGGGGRGDLETEPCCRVLVLGETGAPRADRQCASRDGPPAAWVPTPYFAEGLPFYAVDFMAPSVFLLLLFILLYRFARTARLAPQRCAIWTRSARQTERFLV
jgi:hypothetical protein